MGGTVVIIILLSVVVPVMIIMSGLAADAARPLVMIIMSGLAASAALGFVLKKDVDDQHEGSELLALSEQS